MVRLWGCGGDVSRSESCHIEGRTLHLVNSYSIATQNALFSLLLSVAVAGKYLPSMARTFELPFSGT